MKVKALTEHPYGPYKYKIGDTYYMDDAHVAVMRVLGHITPVEDVKDMKPTPGAKKYQRRDMKPQE